MTPEILAAPWAVRWVESPGMGRRVALGPTQARVFGALVSILGIRRGRPFARIPTQRELADQLGLTVGRVSDTLADLARLGIIDLRTVRGCLGSTAIRWCARRWARRLRRVTEAPSGILAGLFAPAPEGVRRE